MENISSYNDILHFLSNKKIACYGAGNYGKEFIGCVRDKGIEISIIVETEKNDKQDSFCSIPIVSLKDVKNIKKYTWVIAVSDKYFDEMANNLKKTGVSDFLHIDTKALQILRRNVLVNNLELKGIATKERCFILCSGPSIKKQNLKLLKDEDVLSCSWCCWYDDYNIFRPKYYITPGWVYGRLSEKQICEFHEYLSKNITSEIVILDYFDKPYVDYKNLYQNKKLYYIYQQGEWNCNKKKIYDLTKKTPGIQTASIMMVKVAMYLGYRRIYLLGTEHDFFVKEYDHAYSENKLLNQKNLDMYNILNKGKVNINSIPMRQRLLGQFRIYDEYHSLERLAVENDITIINATEGGMLDEFQREKYEGLFV